MYNPVIQSVNSDSGARIKTTSIRPATLVQLHKMGFKLVPLSDDNEVVIPWTPIYDDSNYWSPQKIISDYQRFKNVATVFGQTHIKDEDSHSLFLDGFDCDSEYVYHILTSEIRNPELKAKVQSLVSRFGSNPDSSLLEFLKQTTVIVKTGKEFGYHFYWLSHKQNPCIRAYDCVDGRQFEIKTDKASGHSTLPPSVYRKNPNLRYINIGQSDRIAILDELYGILIELLSECLIKNDNHNRNQYTDRDKKFQGFCQINPIILKNDQIADSANALIDCYQENHRHDIVFEISGLAFKQNIAQESIIAIIKEICGKRNDDEIDNRLDIIQRTYVNGVNGYNLSGSSGLRKVIASIPDYDEQQGTHIIQSLVKIWYRYEIPLSSLSFKKVSSISDEELDKAKITSEHINYCIKTILKEAPNEQIPVRQLFVGMCSSSTHIPQNIGIRTQSGAGKNYMLNKVISKFPQKDIIILSNMTPKALFHDYGMSVVKNPKNGEYEELDMVKDKIDSEIEKKNEQIKEEEKRRTTKEEERNKKAKQSKKEIKVLEREKKSIHARAVKLIDLDGKVLVFLDTPNHNFLANISPILSHDRYEQEYKFVESNSGPIKTKTNVIRGFPTLIFAQASDNSNKERFIEVNRRYLSISVNTSERKVKDAIALKEERAGGARGEYDIKIVDRTEIERTKIILAVLMRKLEKLSRPYKQQLREDKTRKLDDIDSGTFVPFKEVLKTGLPHKHIMDMTSAETYNTYLTLLAKINADSRPKLVYSDGVVIPIATFEDLAAAMSLLQSSSNTGISPEQQQWYEDVFLPVYSEELEKQKQREKEDKEKETEELVSIETTDLIKKHKELSKIGGGRGGYTETTSKDILQKYLYSLINNGYVEMEKVPGRRGSLYRPIKHIRYSFYSFSNEKNIFPYKLKMKVEKPELFPCQNILELEIIESLKCSSEYCEKRGINFKLVNVDGITEITVRELINKYFNNPEDYFIISSKTDKNNKTSQDKEEESNEKNTSDDRSTTSNSSNIEPDKQNNNISPIKEHSEERISDSQNRNKLQIEDQDNIKSVQSSCQAIEKNVLAIKKEQIEYFEDDKVHVMPSAEDEKVDLEYRYGNNKSDDE